MFRAPLGTSVGRCAGNTRIPPRISREGAATQCGQMEAVPQGEDDVKR